MVLLWDSHELERCEGPPDLQFGGVVIQSAEDARVVATDEEYFLALAY